MKKKKKSQESRMKSQVGVTDPIYIHMYVSILYASGWEGAKLAPSVPLLPPSLTPRTGDAWTQLYCFFSCEPHPPP